MTRLQRWIYRDMLDVYYDKEAPFPPELAKVCAMIGARTDEEREIVAELLLVKFTLSDAGYSHERCDTEIAAYRVKAEAAQINGKKGGRPPKNNPAKPSGFQSGSDPVSGINPDLTGSKANQEPITNNQEPKPKVKPTVPASAETAEVFEYWKTVMQHPAAQLDAKRSKAISARLKDGYTVGQLCMAVDGCKYDPFSQGANDRRTVYDDIELICRDGPKVDKFINIASRGPQQSGGRTSNQQQTMDNLQAYLDRNT